MSSIPSFSETGLINFDLSFLEDILSGPVIIHSNLHDDDMPEHFLSFPDISKAINYFYIVKNCSHVPVIIFYSSTEFPRAVEILVDGRLLSSCLDKDCTYDPYLKAYSDESVELPLADDSSHVDVLDTMDSLSPDDDAEPETPSDFNTSDLEMSSIEEYPDDFPDAVMDDEPDEKPRSLKKFISRFKK